MTKETRDMLRANPELAKRLAEHPRAARAIKRCASSCYGNASDQQLARIDKLLERVEREHGEGHAIIVEEYLRAGKDDIELALKNAERWTDVQSIFAEKSKDPDWEPGTHRDDPAYRARADKADEVRPQGRIAEEYLGQALTEHYQNLEREVQIIPNIAPNTPANFWFRADFAGSNAPGHFELHEAKSSPSADLTAQQRAGYALIARFGGTVRSRNKATMPHGTQIPPGTHSFEVRPTFDPMQETAPSSTNRFRFTQLH